MSNEIVAEALTWLGTPYHHQGRVKGFGVDCAMLLCEVYHAVGMIPTLDTPVYPPDWHLHRGEERYLQHIMQYAVEVDEPQAGDVALFKFGRCVSHAAIIVSWPTVIHAYMQHGQVVMSDASQGKLSTRLAGFWRVCDGRQ